MFVMTEAIDMFNTSQGICTRN